MKKQFLYIHVFIRFLQFFINKIHTLRSVDSTILDCELDPMSLERFVLLWIGPSFKKSGNNLGTLESFVGVQSLVTTLLLTSGSVNNKKISQYNKFKK